MIGMEILVVALGGSLGCVSRFLLSRWAQSLWQEQFFPVGIFVVNMLGCLFIGFLAGILIYRLHVGPLWRAGILIGFLGGFTTFSSFSLDTVTLLQSGHIISGVLNVVLSVSVGLLATLVGLLITKS